MIECVHEHEGVHVRAWGMNLIHEGQSSSVVICQWHDLLMCMHAKKRDLMWFYAIWITRLRLWENSGFSQVHKNLGFSQNLKHRLAVLNLPPSDNPVHNCTLSWVVMVVG